jgi:hypothetical protein
MKDNDLRIIQQFLEMTRGSIKNINSKSEYEPIDYYTSWKPGSASYHMHTRTVNIVEMECDMQEFARTIRQFIEFEQLMSTPECRELLEQAKFINYLKNGIRYEPL